MSNRRDRRTRARDLLDRRARAAAEAPDLSEVLRGTLRRRYVRCGKPGCHCMRGRGHGPFVYLSVTLGVGHTEQITIGPSVEDTARHYVQNYERLRRLLERISTINRELLKGSLLSAEPEAAEKHRSTRARRRDEGKDG